MNEIEHNGIRYKKIEHKKYKYQLLRHYMHPTGFRPVRPIDCEFMFLGIDGILTIKQGYAWDGPSGPSIDTENFMRASLVHDALYQLIEHGHLHDRKKADQLMRRICRQDGMSWFRAWYVYRTVRMFGGFYRDFKQCKHK